MTPNGEKTVGYGASKKPDQRFAGQAVEVEPLLPHADLLQGQMNDDYQQVVASFIRCGAAKGTNDCSVGNRIGTPHRSGVYSISSLPTLTLRHVKPASVHSHDLHSTRVSSGMRLCS